VSRHPVPRKVFSRRLRFATVVVGTALLLAEAASAQIVIELDPELLREQALLMQVGGRKEEVMQARNEIVSLWFQHRLHLQEKRLEDADQALEDIKELSHTAMVDESPLLAQALLYEGYMFYEIGNAEAALHAFDQALDFNPALYMAHLGKAHVYFRKNPYNLFAYTMEALRALSGRLQNFWSAYYLASNVFIVLYVAVGIWALATMAVGVLRNMRLVYHETKEKCRRVLPPGASVLLAGGIVFLPAFLWLGPLWLVLFWAVLFWRYFNVVERIATGALLVVLGCFVPTLGVVKHLTLTATDPYVHSSISALTGNFDVSRIKFLRELLEQDPDNPWLAFTLGMLYKNGGFSDEARRHFEHATELDPDFTQAHINIGNVRFQSQEPGEAIHHYKIANEIMPTALAYYNMYQVYNSMFKFTEAEDALDQATLLDSSKVAAYAQRKGTSSQELVVDANPESRDLFSQFLRVRSPAGGGQQAASAAFTGASFLNLFMLLALGTAAAIALYATLNRLSPTARSCIKCGRPYCDQCRVGLESETYCSQCAHLFIKKEGVSPTIRSRKMYEAERYQHRQHMLRFALNLLIPGGGALYVGAFGKGVTLLVFWSVGAAIVAARPWFLSDPMALVAALQIPPLYAGAAVMALPWLAANPWSWLAGSEE
jgi:tetratricopeptide (TPR) repeat protein